MNHFNTSLQTSIIDSKSSQWSTWEGRVAKARESMRVEAGVDSGPEVEVDYSKFCNGDYILSWSTIVAGVEPAEDGHTIIPEHSKWVNENGNSWYNQVLLENYKSFIWAENYLEHIQDKKMSKGKILDAVSWAINVSSNPTIFIDILVATNAKKHPKLGQKIKSGKLNTMSMGCDLTHNQCSKCGEIFDEGSDQCSHIEHHLGKTYKSPVGKSIISEMCGAAGMPGSCTFIESSWVYDPAFKPAQKHGLVTPGESSTGAVLKSFIPEDRFKEAADE